MKKMSVFRVNCFNNLRGQFKIQQMAFVLIAIMIFFAMVSLFYFTIRLSGLRQDVETLREQETLESVRKISGTGEFAWTAKGGCNSCIDMDKVFLLKERTSYSGFWKDIALLQVNRVYPSYGEGIECTNQNYPECDKITLVNEEKSLRGHGAFVALCRYDETEGSQRCDLGKVIMAFETIE